MTEPSLSLVKKTMVVMDAAFDASQHLLWKDPGDPKARAGERRHDVRSSAYYAAGLLVRRDPGDLERACLVIDRVMDNQYHRPGEAVHGTYRRTPEDPPVPEGPLVPWGLYDPNWREFISCTWAFILQEFEAQLPPALVRRMDASARLATQTSYDRRVSLSVPMQTNIELMHVFIADYFGHRLENPAWCTHAEREALKIAQEFRRFGTFSEYNSPTYYGIDLWALGFWRLYSPSSLIQSLGNELEAGVWSDIASLYSPHLKNLSGPFTRSYGLDMQQYVTPTGLYLWVELGPEAAPLPDPAKGPSDTTLPYPQVWDYFYAPMVATMRAAIPADLRPALLSHQGDRTVQKEFVEDGRVCSATAFIEERLMWGALAGSRSVSGQLHPATVYWKDAQERTYGLRLTRRVPGGFWNSAVEGVWFDARATRDTLVVTVTLKRDEPLEVYWEIRGEGLDPSQIGAQEWRLPGLSLKVTAEATPAPRIEGLRNSLEVCYRFEGSTSVRFVLEKALLRY